MQEPQRVRWLRTITSFTSMAVSAASSQVRAVTSTLALRRKCASSVGRRSPSSFATRKTSAARHTQGRSPATARRISVISPRHSTCVPKAHTSAALGRVRCRARARSSQSRCCSTKTIASRSVPRAGMVATATPSLRSVRR